MMKCTSCGAGLESSAHQCPYCGTITAFGVEAERHAAELARRRELHQRELELQSTAGRQRQASTVLDQKATHALLASLAGSFCFCFPVSIASIVLWFRVRSIAREHGLVVPTRATVALVLSVLGLLFTTWVFGSFLLDKRAHEQRLDQLRAELAGPRAQPALDRTTACRLAELHVLENGFGGTQGMSIKNILCPGHVAQAGEAATLDAFQFRAGSTAQVLRVCFAQAPTWSVLGFRRTASCDQPSDVDPAPNRDAGAAAAALNEGDDVPTVNP